MPCQHKNAIHTHVGACQEEGISPPPPSSLSSSPPSSSSLPGTGIHVPLYTQTYLPPHAGFPPSLSSLPPVGYSSWYTCTQNNFLLLLFISRMYTEQGTGVHIELPQQDTCCQLHTTPPPHNKAHTLAHLLLHGLVTCHTAISS